MLNEFLHCEQLFRLGNSGHGKLVLYGTRLLHVKRGLADQNRLPMLDCPHRSHRETSTISCTIYLVQHRNLRVSYKITKQLQVSVTNYFMIVELKLAVIEGETSPARTK